MEQLASNVRFIKVDPNVLRAQERRQPPHPCPPPLDGKHGGSRLPSEGPGLVPAEAPPGGLCRHPQGFSLLGVSLPGMKSPGVWD